MMYTVCDGGGNNDCIPYTMGVVIMTVVVMKDGNECKPYTMEMVMNVYRMRWRW